MRERQELQQSSRVRRDILNLELTRPGYNICINDISNVYKLLINSLGKPPSPPPPIHYLASVMPLICNFYAVPVQRSAGQSCIIVLTFQSLYVSLGFMCRLVQSAAYSAGQCSASLYQVRSADTRVRLSPTPHPQHEQHVSA